MAVILIGLLMLFSSLEAKDLGTHGHVFPIEEEDLLVLLKYKMNALSEEEGKAVQQKVQDHYVSLIRKPKSLNLSEAQTYRVAYFDPKICADQDIKDAEGKIIVSKGTCINPFENISHLDALLFFDADNPQHLEWARTQKNLVKWIVTNGRPLDLETSENRRVFFDQFGMLAEKFQITHIPAKVSKEGLRLKVEEIPMETR